MGKAVITGGLEKGLGLGSAVRVTRAWLETLLSNLVKPERTQVEGT